MQSTGPGGSTTVTGARTLGAVHITLVAPYLAYMRQDMAFAPGEAVSQRIGGSFLADLFDAVITVDPHLHRIHTLEEAVPVPRTAVLSGAPLLARPDRTTAAGGAAHRA